MLIRRAVALALIGTMVVVAGGCRTGRPWVPSPTLGGPSAGCPTARPPSTFAGGTLTVRQALRYAYDAGFRTPGQLRAVVGIGEAESGLVTKARRWHPEFGCRPASDAVGVQGPASAWNADHTRQLYSDRGAWQISAHYWPQFSDARCDDPASAARIMYELSAHGSNFGPWDTYPSPALSLAPSTAAVNAFLAGR